MKIPPEVVQYVGEKPSPIPGAPNIATYSEGGYVAEIGAPEAIDRERALLTKELGDLPVLTPLVIDWDVSWIVLEDIPDSEQDWSDEELATALGQLAKLHDVFEESPKLEAASLRRPFGADINELLAPARSTRWDLPAELADLLANPGPLLEVLCSEPQTLLHGDPWPFNLRRSGGEIVWINWSQASVGPAAADIASWLDQTPFHIGRPIDRLTHINTYLDARERRPDWEAFSKALDASRVLWFLAYDMPQIPALAEERPELGEKMNEEAERAYRAFAGK